MNNNKIDIAEGMCFESYNQFRQHLTNYCKKVNQVFVTFKSDTENSKSYSKKLQDGILYHMIHYTCKHGPRSKECTATERDTRSLKLDCPAEIIVRASRKGEKLVIKKAFLRHEGHDDASIAPPPELRRLNDQQMIEVKKYIKVNADRDKLLHIINNEMNVPTTVKDLKNFVAASKKKGKQMDSVLELLDAKNAKVDILTEDKEIQGIFFTTPAMRNSVEAWGEMVFFDGTYNLVDNKFVVFLFVVENGMTETEIAAIGYILHEDQPTLNWLIECFKKHHLSAYKKIKYFMCDKNRAQRNAIKSFFPEAKLLICYYHTIEIFRREISKMEIKQVTKDLCWEIFKRIARIKSTDAYEFVYEKFMNHAEIPVVAKLYFNKNWHRIYQQWTCFDELEGTFWNRTNNRTESLNQKLKIYMGIRNKLYDSFEKFFQWLEFHDKQIKLSITKNFNTTPSQISSEEIPYEKILIEAPFNIVSTELKNRKYLLFDKIYENEFHITASKRVTTCNKCNCYIFVSHQLPCRHIFCAREMEGLPLFAEELCNVRWTKSYTRQMSNVYRSQMHSSSSKLPPTIQEKVYDSNKYDTKLENLLEDIVDVASLNCKQSFVNKLSTLYTVIEMIENDEISNMRVVTNEESQSELDMKMQDILIKLNHLNFITNYNGPESVIKKRKRLLKLLQYFNNNEKLIQNTKNLEMTVSILTEIKNTWFEGKEVQIVNDPPEKERELQAPTQVNELVPPKTINIRGKPRHANVTNTSYSSRKKKPSACNKQ